MSKKWTEGGIIKPQFLRYRYSKSNGCRNMDKHFTKLQHGRLWIWSTLLLTFFIMASVPNFATANGGPVAELSALTNARMPMMRHCPEVQLLREQVRFTPCGRYTEVRVKYLLHNRSGHDMRDIWYGFPIDWYGDNNPVVWATVNPYTDYYGREACWRDDYIQDVSFSLNGSALEWHCSADTILRAGIMLEDEEEFFETDSPTLHNSQGEEFTLDSVFRHDWYGLYKLENNLNRRWYYTALSLQAGETAVLTVCYRLHTHTLIGFWFADVFVKNSSEFHDFEYDFSPASYWGDGRVGEFYMEVDTGRLMNGMYSYELPYYTNFSSEEYPLQPVGGTVLAWHTTDFDLTNAKPYTMEYKLPAQLREIDELLTLRVSPAKYTIETSGKKREVNIASLSDLNLKTATRVPFDKQDSCYITIHFADSMYVTGIILYSGHTQDSATWHDYGRIKCLTIPQVDLPMYPPLIYEEKKPDGFDWQSLTDAAFAIPTNPYPREPGEVFYFERWNSFKVKDLRINIAEIIPGNKSAELYIGEIVVLGE